MSRGVIGPLWEI